ncbi:MAG: hypothetical protein BWZ08_02277 [candidate division BRC1 bacterium ADurb.BinA292]|nr:MAG: hypothetical protein BWZ08_02277 [candidate division BRC1 bacterium ADurb.BinA292]
MFVRLKLTDILLYIQIGELHVLTPVEIDMEHDIAIARVAGDRRDPLDRGHLALDVHRQQALGLLRRQAVGRHHHGDARRAHVGEQIERQPAIRQPAQQDQAGEEHRHLDRILDARPQHPRPSLKTTSLVPRPRLSIIAQVQMKLGRTRGRLNAARRGRIPATPGALEIDSSHGLSRNCGQMVPRRLGGDCAVRFRPMLPAAHR